VNAISVSQLLHPGWNMDQVPREYIQGLLEKAFAQGLTGMDVRITFTNRFDDECRIEVPGTQ
jgi:hypothetical protein